MFSGWYFFPTSTNGSQSLPAFFFFVLLHAQLPEEQAFALLVKIMKDYGLRDIFKCDFEQLHVKFFQLERMIEVPCMDCSLWWDIRDQKSWVHLLLQTSYVKTRELTKINVLSIIDNTSLILLIIFSSVSTLIFIGVWHKYCGNNISKLFYVSLAKRLVKFGKFLKYTLSPIAVQAYLSLLNFRTKLWQPCETIGKFENFSNIGHLVPKTQRGSSEKLMRLVRHEYYWYWRLNISFVLFCFFFFRILCQTCTVISSTMI